MIFLIEYSRSDDRLVSFKAYPDEARQQADDDRLALELDLLRLGIEHEVVNIKADSEDILRRSYRRYFESVLPATNSVPSTNH